MTTTRETTGMNFMRTMRAALAATVLGAGIAGPASAQDYRSSIGWNAGAIWVSSLNSGAGLSAVLGNDETARDLEPGVSWIAGLHVDHWVRGGIFGVRASGAYTRQSVEWASRTRDIGSWSGDLSLMVRPLVPYADRTLSPFLALGVGGIQYGFGDGPATSYPEANAAHLGDQRFELAAVGGAGIDYISPWVWDDAPLIFRLEAADMVAFESPLRRVDNGDDFGLVHNIRITLGIHAGLGSLFGGGSVAAARE